MISGCFVVALGLASQLGAESSPQASFLSAVADGYEGNRSKFTHGVVQFEFQDGFADSAERARRGELTDVCTALCVYAFHLEGRRPQYRYSKEFTE